MSENRPRVGGASTEFTGRCEYSLAPGHPQCEMPAAVHVRVISVDHGEVSLATCGTHADIARASGLYRDEHPFGGWCGWLLTRWNGDHCDLDTGQV